MSTARKDWEAKAMLARGEINAGLRIKGDGQPDYILVVMTARHNQVILAGSAANWAKAVGGELPSMSDLYLIRANTDLFDTELKGASVISSSMYKSDHNVFWGNGEISVTDSFKVTAIAIRKIYLN